MHTRKLSITRDLPPVPTPLPGTMHLTDKEFQAFRKLIFHEAGISLSDAKRALVASRLARRLRHFGFTSYAQYYQYLMDQDPDGVERVQMVNCLTTNKTNFFREPHHFTFLREHVMPQLQAQVRQGAPARMRFWSAGCSTGEEPYSLAMTVREALPSLVNWDIKILASDIDTSVLQTAERGIYAADRLEGVSDERHRRHFLRGRGEWAGTYQIKSELQQVIAFRRINLNEEPWPIRTRFHAILCRNVVIYFNRETQRRLFERFAEVLEPNGHLIVGHSEALVGLSERFLPLRGSVYRLR